MKYYETSTTTVHAPKRILAGKGVKQVNSCTSGERGQLVTTCVIISASGTYIPPVMVFPRKKFKEHMLKGGPPGTLGLANPSGWMNSTLFPEVMDHFIKHTESTKDRPSMLIFDNHESHISIDVVEKARNAGVHILTLPPHTSNKTQPLDVAVFTPFKNYYNSACSSWMIRHPGVPLTIYDISECVAEALTKALTPANIIAGFKKCGIYPLDRNVFSESPSNATLEEESFSRQSTSSVTHENIPATTNVETCEQLTPKKNEDTTANNPNILKEIHFSAPVFGVSQSTTKKGHTEKTTRKETQCNHYRHS
ncbi:hypothetical protein NQ315_000600 [Exocentrus adspersus]|uniref:DDE-1 domain-containing protein n=1 Tax=Exocentrus adspersus TaxID=1586481 RepID=A0AAV8VN59_9CUCU|nr:hypothetical protein NQ315_000600 [Exocentrus adspersus]